MAQAQIGTNKADALQESEIKAVVVIIETVFALDRPTFNSSGKKTSETEETSSPHSERCAGTRR